MLIFMEKQPWSPKEKDQNKQQAKLSKLSLALRKNLQRRKSGAKNKHE